MSAVVLDTGVLIDVLRGHPGALSFLSGLAEVPVCSEVTRTEVLQGMRSSERASTRSLLDALDWLAVDELVSSTAGAIGRKYRRSHAGLGIADLMVAATATLMHASLATTNPRHYPMFPGLRPPYGA